MIPIKRKIVKSKHASGNVRESVYVGDDETIKECDGIMARARVMIDRINNPDKSDREIMEMPYDDVRERLGLEKVGGAEGSGTYEEWLKSRLELIGWFDEEFKKMTPHVFMTTREGMIDRGINAVREWLVSQVKNLKLAPGGNRP